MITKRMLSAAALLATLWLSACDRTPDAPAGNPAQVGEASDTSASASLDREDPRDVAAPKVDGKPMWSANKKYTAEENAKYHFERNGEAFGAKDVDDYVRKAHAFTTRPPAGVERVKRASNGDTLLYDAKDNIFAVVTKDGAPRTMFKPDDGPTYWQRQKDKETASAKSGDRGEG